MAPISGFSAHITVHIDPTNVDKFFEHMRPVYDAVVAEPELLFFEIYQSPENPGELHWVENWSEQCENLSVFEIDFDRSKSAEWFMKVRC